MDRTSNPAPDAPQSDCLRDRDRTHLGQRKVRSVLFPTAPPMARHFTTRECDGGGGSAMKKVAVGSRPSGESSMVPARWEFWRGRVTFLPVPGSGGRGGDPAPIRERCHEQNDRPCRRPVRRMRHRAEPRSEPRLEPEHGGSVRRDGPTVKVMTRNLYLGADILPMARRRAERRPSSPPTSCGPPCRPPASRPARRPWPGRSPRRAPTSSRSRR